MKYRYSFLNLTYKADVIDLVDFLKTLEEPLKYESIIFFRPFLSLTKASLFMCFSALLNSFESLHPLIKTWIDHLRSTLYFTHH